MVAKVDGEATTLDRPTTVHSGTSNGGYRLKLTPLRTSEAKCDAVGQFEERLGEKRNNEIKST